MTFGALLGALVGTFGKYIYPEDDINIDIHEQQMKWHDSHSFYMIVFIKDGIIIKIKWFKPIYIIIIVITTYEQICRRFKFIVQPLEISMYSVEWLSITLCKCQCVRTALVFLIYIIYVYMCVIMCPYVHLISIFSIVFSSSNWYILLF